MKLFMRHDYGLRFSLFLFVFGICLHPPRLHSAPALSRARGAGVSRVVFFGVDAFLAVNLQTVLAPC